MVPADRGRAAGPCGTRPARLRPHGRHTHAFPGGRAVAHSRPHGGPTTQCALVNLEPAAVDPGRGRQTARRIVPPNLGSVPQVAEPEVDLAVLDTQTQTLFNSLMLVAAVVGLWGICSEVPPALAVFEDISLWTYTWTLDGQEHVIPMTLADIGMALIITIIAVVAVRNLPALWRSPCCNAPPFPRVAATRSRPSPATSSSSPPPSPSSVPSGSPGPKYSGSWPPSAWASVSACRRS